MDAIQQMEGKKLDGRKQENGEKKYRVGERKRKDREMRFRKETNILSREKNSLISVTS